MGTSVTGTWLVQQASELVGDTDNVNRTTAQGLQWVNEAQLAVAMVRSDASNETISQKLVAGTRQTITGRSLQRVRRNMGSDGKTPGNVVFQVDMDVKDASDPDWHTATPDTTVVEFMFDSIDQKAFYVSPPVANSGSTYVELTQAVDPAFLGALADVIALDDIYAPAMINWICFRWLGRDAEDTPNWVRAQAYLQAFFQALGAEYRADLADDPHLSAAAPARV